MLTVPEMQQFALRPNWDKLDEAIYEKQSKYKHDTVINLSINFKINLISSVRQQI